MTGIIFSHVKLQIIGIILLNDIVINKFIIVGSNQFIDHFINASICLQRGKS